MMGLNHHLMHTYIIGHYNPSVRITTQIITPLKLCALILNMSSRTYSLKSTPNAKFIGETFHGNFILTLRVFARNLLRESRRRNIFSYLIFDDWQGIRTQAFESNKRFFGDYISADFWQKLWDKINLPLKSFSKICRS